MMLSYLEVYKTEKQNVALQQPVKTEGNCIHYWKYFQVRHNHGHNILKCFKILVEFWFTKSEKVRGIKKKNVVTELSYELRK